MGGVLATQAGHLAEAWASLSRAFLARAGGRAGGRAGVELQRFWISGPLAPPGHHSEEDA